MDQDDHCPGCGATLPMDAPEGLCPSCLMTSALEEPGRSDPETPTRFDDGPLFFSVRSGEGTALEEVPGRYEQIGEHSRGGMGRILLVHDQSIGRDVALKELLPSDEEAPGSTPERHSGAAVARFLREARLTGQLEHPGIVPVYEVGQRAGGALYYTMKLVRGKTLRGVLEETDSLDQRMKLLPHIVDLCQAMAYAHSRGVIHRDLKPDNVMIGEFGETVVIDWGIAKTRGPGATPGDSAKYPEGPQMATEDAHIIKTMNGVVMGTPAYMSPEQALGDLACVDERSDVYALGAVLYEVLTGEPPFTGENSREVLLKVQTESPSPPRRLEHRIPRELAVICERALARDPADRFASAKDMAEALQSFVSGRVFGARQARVSFLTGVYGFGAALMAGGLGILASSYQSQIPASVRVAVLCGIVVALYAGGVYFDRNRGHHRVGNTLTLLGALMMGAGLFFCGAVYGLKFLAFDRSTAWELWALCALAGAYALRSSPSALVAAAAGFASFILPAVSRDGYDFPPGFAWWFPCAAAAALLPFAYLRVSRDVFGVALAMIATSAALVSANNGQMTRVWLAILASCALFFAWGLLSYPSERYRQFAILASGLGAVGLAAVFCILLSQDSWAFYTATFKGWSNHTAYDLDWVPFALLCGTAFVLWWLAIKRGFVWPNLYSLARVFLPCILLAALAVLIGAAYAGRPGEEGSLGHWITFLTMDASALLFGATAAWTGVKLEDRSIFLSGCLFVALGILFRLFEADMGLKGKAIVLVGLGVAAVAAGLKFQRVLKKRRLI